ncbi:hypothetical protein C5C45_00500 [Rathayibacter rathayi]|uniref:Uncharacterized protein n=1 Tax=Rathayibacter rathayi TaxID=33887 RepID=A0ABX5AFW8_RATRA|nr:hypothetical protein C5C34_05915 [Rathayibacter rathayi]PPF51587.1 hypothetical protein C5C08_01905 [Rathayibacter rathayi]PPF83178.1 hypothetical protein C5C14_01945 [Rathayibacter rathayi]PPG47008.1 hypothetical protein C5C20_01900 [Rathayibacter rathayi]PPG96531.1 hypothetical protein C5C22_02625 [Rathayibacter rathayi]
MYVALDTPLGDHSRANLLTRTFGIPGCGLFVSLLVRAIVADYQRRAQMVVAVATGTLLVAQRALFLCADWPVTDLGVASHDDRPDTRAYSILLYGALGVMATTGLAALSSSTSRSCDSSMS